LNVCGRLLVDWYEAKDHYFTEESVLSYVEYIFGSEDGEVTQLDSGSYTYNFNCSLPAGLPSSFEGQHGSIRYHIEAVFVRPWKIINPSAKVPFKVITSHDLNLKPLLKVPLQAEEVKTFCCWICTSGPLIITAKIQFTGYVGGQNIDISVAVQNTTNVNVNRIVLRLVRATVYHVDSEELRKMAVCKVVSEEKISGVSRGTSKILEGQLVVPNLTSQVKTDFIDASFEIHVTAEVSGVHVDPVLILPIEIGTVPLLFESGSSDSLINKF